MTRREIASRLKKLSKSLQKSYPYLQTFIHARKKFKKGGMAKEEKKLKSQLKKPSKSLQKSYPYP